MKQVSLGLVGAGRIGRVHSLSIRQILNSKLAAVADPVPGKAEEIAEEQNADTYLDYKELLNRKDVDGVIVCVPTWAHRSVTVEAAEAGKHIYCEKPMALSLQEADEMIRAAENSGVKLMIGENARFRFRRVKELVDQGAIGDISVIRSSLSAWSPVGTAEWMCDPKKGGGMIVDSSVHNADFTRWLAGSEVERVYAESGAFFIDECKDMGTEDNAVYLLKFKNGVIGEVHCSWTGRGVGGYSLEVFGSGGMISIHPLRQRLMVYSTKDVPDKFVFGGGIQEGWNFTSLAFNPMPNLSGHLDAVRHFVDCILEDKEPMTNGKEGRAALEIVIAAYKSSKVNRPVKLPLEY